MAGLALALALLALVLLSPTRAPARGTIARRGTCPAATKHVKHAVKASHCTKRATRHRKPAAHQPSKHSHPVSKGTHKSPSTPAGQTPALCEDASAPVRSGSEFSCQDGSEPSCEDGTEPLAAAGSAIPLCPVEDESPSQAPGEECSLEASAECQSAEWACEGSSDAGEAALPCERAGTGEAVS
jgi:hypothetical protein